MHKHSEERVLPHSPAAIFNLVADVESYPDFLPWCTATRILKQNESGMIAEMAVGYKSIRERYKSNVELNRDAMIIKVTAIDGPFKYLRNQWYFEECNIDQCKIHFHIEFEFGSWILQQIIGAFFEDAVAKMVLAFETRANEIYNPCSLD